VGSVSGAEVIQGYPDALCSECSQRLFNVFSSPAQKNDYDAFADCDSEFHTTIVANTGNALMDDMYNRLRVHMHIARGHHISVLETASRVNEQHALIIDSIRREDLAGAEQAILFHLQHMKRAMIENIQAIGGGL
jgi:DNA-binding GntR family transcriptional regulator